MGKYCFSGKLDIQSIVEAGAMRQGSVEKGKGTPQTHAPSLANARGILRFAALNGLVTWPGRFSHKCALHGINTTDAVGILCTGTLIGGNEFDARNNGWRYRLVGLVEGRKLCVEVLLDCLYDFAESPFVTLITAMWWRGRIKLMKE